MRGRVSLKPARELPEWKRLLGEALPIAIAASVGAFFYRSAILIMSIIATPEETGYFSASFRVVEAIIIVVSLIAASVFPILTRAASSDRERLRYAMQRLFDVGVILGSGRRSVSWSALTPSCGSSAGQTSNLPHRFSGSRASRSHVASSLLSGRLGSGLCVANGHLPSRT